jgi:NAD(P)-dependent dehydrogenase (short-subunit alcohol dehydrogenase family)
MKSKSNIFDLTGKTILLTGATGHLGRSMAHALAKAGACVLVNSRSSQRSEQIASELNNEGYVAEAATFDIRDSEAIDAYLFELGKRPLNAIINNAYAGGSGSIELSRQASYAESYDITLLASHNLLRAALPSLRRAVTETGDASIINMASMYALVSPDQRIYGSPSGVNPPFYGAAKAALVQWTRYAACEFGHEGIRVNSISPGPFPSDSVQANESEFVNRLAQRVPLGRVGQAHEINGPVLFLVSSAASFVNGANLVVDGGWTAW